eukprot:13557441-Alexandrium_andersonii.AAC.1
MRGPTQSWGEARKQTQRRRLEGQRESIFRMCSTLRLGQHASRLWRSVQGVTSSERPHGTFESLGRPPRDKR